MMAQHRILSLVAGLLSVAAMGCSDREQMSETVSRQERPAVSVPAIGANEAEALVAGGGLLVDVREPAELAETGRLQGAVNVRMPAIRAHAAGGRLPTELQSYAKRPVIFYCRSGRRAAEAAETLRQLGLSEVYNLGGFDDAVRGGLAAVPERRPTT